MKLGNPDIVSSQAPVSLVSGPRVSWTFYGGDVYSLNPVAPLPWQPPVGRMASVSGQRLIKGRPSTCSKPAVVAACSVAKLTTARCC
eukprot:7007430-Lingulodinium_polyedra.AAC.1